MPPSSPPRTFTDSPAVRAAVPLWVGLMGPSGGGKTYSALRLAAGIQKIQGGDVYYIDTESGRALHYADKFKFRHVPFKAPFGSLDYLAALEYVASKNPGVVVVDSMSHEHEGPGGYLDLHEQETKRIAAEWKVQLGKAQVPAWNRPAQERQRFINTALQMRGAFIFCFRSKEKLKLKTGQDIVELGWMPIAGQSFLFEMTVCGLLLPGAKGVPTWQTEFPGEKMMIKNPTQFDWLYREEKPLDEATGEALAKWAAGGTTAVSAGASSPGTQTISSESKSPAPPPPAASAASPGLDMLMSQLAANGERTPAARQLWIRKLTGKAPESLTVEELTLCIERAEQDAA